jgi:hypothetical protein
MEDGTSSISFKIAFASLFFGVFLPFITSSFGIDRFVSVFWWNIYTSGTMVYNFLYYSLSLKYYVLFFLLNIFFTVISFIFVFYISEFLIKYSKRVRLIIFLFLSISAFIIPIDTARRMRLVYVSDYFAM